MDRDGITPPDELVEQWISEASYKDTSEVFHEHIAVMAAQWGADQELDACCEWLVRDWTSIETADKLRAARRPTTMSLKEQALEAWERCAFGKPRDRDIIRRALDQLSDG
jgi:hypothetical protein